jgi:hypothetical protein
MRSVLEHHVLTDPVVKIRITEIKRADILDYRGAAGGEDGLHPHGAASGERAQDRVERGVLEEGLNSTRPDRNREAHALPLPAWSFVRPLGSGPAHCSAMDPGTDERINLVYLRDIGARRAARSALLWLRLTLAPTLVYVPRTPPPRPRTTASIPDPLPRWSPGHVVVANRREQHG